MFFTTYKLALESGLDTNCPEFRETVRVFGTPVEYGEDKPIALGLIFSRVGIGAALWALRAVYPEQRTSARSLARRVALEASSEGLEIYSGNNIAHDAYNVASNFLEGAASLEDLATHRKRLRVCLWRYSPAELLFVYATLHALSERPELYAVSAYNLGLEIGPEQGDRDDFKAHMDDYLSDDFAPSEFGPGVITDPIGKGRPRKDGLPTGSGKGRIGNRSKLTFRDRGVKGTQSFSEVLAFMRENR